MTTMYYILIGAGYIFIPIVFPLIYMYFCGKYIKNFNYEAAAENPIHAFFSWVLPVALLLGLWSFTSFDWDGLVIYSYLVFEFVASLFIFMYYVDNTQEGFSARNKYYQQKLKFGLDINDLDVGQVVITIKNTGKERKHWVLHFNEVYEKQDSTGVYKLLEETHRNYKDTAWNEEQIKQEVKSYLESKTTYVVNKTSGEPMVVNGADKRYKTLVISD